jgi:hypothetical protein
VVSQALFQIRTDSNRLDAESGGRNLSTSKQLDQGTVEFTEGNSSRPVSSSHDRNSCEVCRGAHRGEQKGEMKMLVHELIEQLKHVPQELPVGTQDFGAINGVWISDRKANDSEEPTRVVYLSKHSSGAGSKKETTV